jgi:peptidoglycan/LPS O-acetylase OafA/YrhL
MTAIGPMYRLFLVVGWKYLQSDASGLNSYISTPTALDSLGIGSVIAIMMSTEAGRSRIRRWMRFLVPFIGLVLAAVVYYRKWWSMVLFDTGTAMFFGWLIYRASSGFKGIAGRVLGASPLVFIGRISYGIYVYHPLVPAAVSTLAAAIGFSLPGGVWEKMILIGLTLLVSTVSWYSFERPITNLKRHFR